MQEVRGGALRAHQDLGGRGFAAPMPGLQRSPLPVFCARSGFIDGETQIPLTSAPRGACHRSYHGKTRGSRSGTRMTCIGLQSPLVSFGVTATAGKSQCFVRV